MKAIINSIHLTPRRVRKTTRNIGLQINAMKNSAVRIMLEDTTNNKWYNFTDKVFQANADSLKHKFTSDGIFTKEMVLPTVSSDTDYTVEVIAINSDISSSASNNPKLFTKTISQLVDTTVTIAAQTDTSGDYITGDTWPTSVQVTSPAIGITNKTVSIDWTVKAVASVSASALTIVRQPGLNDFYVETGNYTADGSGTSSTSLTLTSVSGLHVGMQLSHVAGTYQSELRTITNVNGITKTVTLSGNETWSDTNNIKFRGYGGDLMYLHSGIDIEDELLSVTTEDITKVVNGATGTRAGGSASTDVTLVDCLGLKASDTVTVTSPNIESSTPVYLDSIVNFSSKIIRLSSAQSFADKEVLTFSGSAQTANIKLNLVLKKQPAQNTNIYFDVDNVLTSATS
tara:strand:- start:1537 stop:2736 length:1200 start_codon:yes stop_codon:yes gene_type:complete